MMAKILSFVFVIILILPMFAASASTVTDDRSEDIQVIQLEIQEQTGSGLRALQNDDGCIPFKSPDGSDIQVIAKVCPLSLKANLDVNDAEGTEGENTLLKISLDKNSDGDAKCLSLSFPNVAAVETAGCLYIRPENPDEPEKKQCFGAELTAKLGTRKFVIAAPIICF